MLSSRTMETKICSECGESRPIDKFPKKKNKGYSHINVGKRCGKCVYKRLIQRGNDYAIQQKKYLKSNAEYRDKIKARVLARKRFGSAQDFNCVFPLCEHPASNLHHIDYNKPFLVFPVCYKHHREIHTEVD